MVASSKSVVRWLVVSLLVSTVFAFTAPTPIPHAVRQIPIKPILLASPSVQRMAVDTNGLFGEKRSARRLPSLRRFFRNFVQFATKNKRRRLSSLVFAATVWSRGVVHYQDMPVAHATPAPVERLAPNLHLHGGSTDESATIENAEVEDAVAAKPKPSRAAVNRKLATAGTVLLVPAGYLAIRGEKDDESTCVSTDSSGEDAGALESTGGTDDDTIEEEIPEEEKKTLVRNVLDTAKKARLKVDPDTYLKTLQKEKSVISSAISKLKQKVQSSPPENKSAKAELDAKEPVSASTSSGTVANYATSKDVELPLMTPQFIRARQQPKSPAEEQRLQKKYASISDIGERAFAILVDLGMVETQDATVAVGLP